MLYPHTKNEFLKTMKETENLVHEKPNVFLDSMRKMLMTWAYLYELISVRELDLQKAIDELCTKTDEEGGLLVTRAEAEQFANLYSVIDWTGDGPAKVVEETEKEKAQKAKEAEIEAVAKEEAELLEKAAKAHELKERMRKFHMERAKKTQRHRQRNRQRGGGVLGVIDTVIKKLSPELRNEVQNIWKESKDTKVAQRFAYGKNQDLLSVEYSIDEAVGRTISIVNMLDQYASTVTTRVGIWALEDKMPFYKKVIPTQFLYSMVIVVFELIRMILTILPDSLFNWINPIVSVVMAIMELGRGDWKHAFLTLQGSIRSTFWGSMRWKLILNSFMLISPEMKYQMIALVLEAPRELCRGFIFWILTYVMPRQNMIAEFRDIFFEISGVPPTKIGYLRVEDFYKLRTILLSNGILCTTPMHMLLRHITEIKPWFVFFIPFHILKSMMGTPKVAEKEVFATQCNENIIVSVYNVLHKLIDKKANGEGKDGGENKKPIKPFRTRIDSALERLADNPLKFEGMEEGSAGTDPKAKPLTKTKVIENWKKILTILETYIDKPFAFMKAKGVNPHQVFDPIINIKGPLKEYFTEKFRNELKAQITKDIEEFDKWITLFPKNQIMDFTRSTEFLDNIIFKDIGILLKDYGAIGEKIKELKEPLSSLFAILSHADDPTTILKKNNLTLKEIFSPIEAIQGEMIGPIKSYIRNNDIVGLVRWFRDKEKPGQAMFYSNDASYGDAIKKIVNIVKKMKDIKGYESPPMSERLQKTTEDFLKKRTRSQRGRKQRQGLARARTRKTRR